MHGPWKYRGGAGKKQGRTGKEAARTGKDLVTTDWENRRREESGRELATKTEPEKIREGMGDKRGRSMEKMERNQQSKNWEGPGKNLEGTGKDQRSELHHATNLLNTVWPHLYAAMHLLFHAFRFSARPGFSNVFNMFLFIFFTMALGVHFCAFRVPHG